MELDIFAKEIGCWFPVIFKENIQKTFLRLPISCIWLIGKGFKIMTHFGNNARKISDKTIYMIMLRFWAFI